MTLATDFSRNGFKRHHDTSAADTALVVSSPAPGINKPFRLLYISVIYSAAPTQTGVVLEIDSGSGAAFDITLQTGSADVLETFFQPAADLFLLHDDIVKVTAPSAGGAITSTVIIATQEIE